MNAGGLRPTLRNVLTVARREFLWRGRSRTFLISTLFLVVIAVAVALAPTILRFINRLDTGETIGVYAGSTTTSIEFARARGALGSTAETVPPAGPRRGRPFTIIDVTDRPPPALMSGLVSSRRSWSSNAPAATSATRSTRTCCRSSERSS
jgi:hypothetical protein